jgi:hypothetical protein
MIADEERGGEPEERLPLPDDQPEREQPGERERSGGSDATDSAVERESLAERSARSGEQSVPTDPEIDEERQAG